MATMSIRGLNNQALAELKNQAQQEGSSLNALALRLLQGSGQLAPRNSLKKFDDLDALAGSWGSDEVLVFERATAALGAIDAALWT